MKKFFKKTEGFTLVELIVVIAILGILAGVGTVGYSGYIKKAQTAADNQLLAAVNQAFAAACIENGVDHSSITSASIVWNSTNDKAVSGVDVADTIAKDDAIEAAFAKYFVGNESNEFKTTDKNKGLAFSRGVFMLPGEGRTLSYNGYDFVVSEAAIQAIQNSTYGKTIGAQKLLGQVSDVADLAYQSILGNDEGVLGQIVLDPTYFGNLATSLGMTSTELEEYLETQDDGGMQFMANSLVLSVAQSTAGKSSSDVADKITATTFVSELGGRLNDSATAQDALADAALAYGVYTSYVYAKGSAEEQAALSNITDFTSLKSALNVMQSTEFQTYLDSAEGQADLNAYLSSMDVISSTTGTPDATKAVLENGFSDSDLETLLNGIMTGN